VYWKNRYIFKHWTSPISLCTQYGGCSNGVPPIHIFQTEHRIQFKSRPMRFLGFSNHETVSSTFSRSGWSVVRSASLAEGGTSKKRPSPHLYKVPTRSNKVSLRTFQTALDRGRFLPYHPQFLFEQVACDFSMGAVHNVCCCHGNTKVKCFEC
jgi:hypothetical protein